MAGEDADKIELVFIYTVGVAGAVINILGLVGNALSLVTLTRPELKASNSNLYLLVLSIYDVIFLFLDLSLTSLDWIVLGVDRTSLFSLQFVYPAAVVIDPLISSLISASVYTTLALTVDRCIAVARPLHWSTVCTRTRIKLILVLVALWAVLVNAPLFAELKWEEVHLRSINKTFLLSGPTEYSQTEFHKVVYLQGIVPTVTMVIPVGVILICNTIIVTKMRASGKNVTSSQSASARARDTNRLTAQVFCISVLTLVSRLLHAVTYILMNLEDTTFVTRCSLACGCIAAISVFFIKINAATNFIFYCYFGKKFRSVFLATFPCLRCQCRSAPGHSQQRPVVNSASPNQEKTSATAGPISQSQNETQQTDVIIK